MNEKPDITEASHAPVPSHRIFTGMTDEERRQIRDAIDVVCEIKTLLDLAMMASIGVQDRDDGEAMYKICDLAHAQAKAARKQLYAFIGQEPPGGAQ